MFLKESDLTSAHTHRDSGKEKQAESEMGYSKSHLSQIKNGLLV